MVQAGERCPKWSKLEGQPLGSLPAPVNTEEVAPDDDPDLEDFAFFVAG